MTDHRMMQIYKMSLAAVAGLFMTGIAGTVLTLSGGLA